MIYDQHGIRGLNCKNVFMFIAQRGKVSRTEIIQSLGSSTTTILKITDYLQTKGLIFISGEKKTSKGRRPQILEFMPEKVCAVGIDYDGKSVKLGICDYYGKVLFSIKQHASRDILTFFKKQLPKLFNTALENSKFDRNNILGVGISMPGEFNSTASEYYLNPSCLFENVDKLEAMLSAFSKEIDFPVYCYNDVNAAAFGEYLKRDQSVKNLIFILCGDGVGSGLILDGKLWAGERYAAGEIGYFTNDVNAHQDFSVPGWFESRLSDKFLNEKFAEAGAGNKSPEYIEYIAKMIAIITANVTNLLDISLVVLDGSLFDGNKDLIFPIIQEYVNKLCLNKVIIDKSICNFPTLSGAAALVINNEIDNFLDS